jgi:hypothetical protein
VFHFNCKSAVVNAYSDRPLFADLLEVERGMRSVMLEQFEASVCNPLNLLRESVIMGPEIE